MWGVCSIMKRLEVVDEEMKIVLLLLDQELANCRIFKREAGHSHHQIYWGGLCDTDKSGHRNSVIGKE